MSGVKCSYCDNRMPKASLRAHMELEHKEMLAVVKCEYCWNPMPRKSIEKHQIKCHSLHCVYCGHVVLAASIEVHVLNAHDAIHRELQKIRNEGVEEGKRECLKQLYIDCCTVCKRKISKTSLDEHEGELHPPVRPVHVPFYQPGGLYLPPRRNVCNLYLHEQTADIFFVFENHPRVAAHKCILASDSMVFHRMFYGPIEEIHSVKIADASLDGFLVFLESFYKSRMAITEENVADILFLANKYDAIKCTKFCQDFLTVNLCNENVLSRLELSLMYNYGLLRELCVKKLMQAGRAIIQTDSFYHANRDVLRQVLSTDFQGRNELILFEACMEWAKQSCQKEKVDASEMSCIRWKLSDCFDLIRFDSMTPLQFVQCQTNFPDIFTKDELKDITNAIVAQHGNCEINQPDTSSSSNFADVADCVPKYSFTGKIKNSFAEIESLFENKETANVFFVVMINSNEWKLISAHKCILANNSTKFYQLFYGPDKENVDIYFHQSSADIFSLFLQSFYGKIMTLTMDNVVEVLQLADEYDARICLNDCEKFLTSQLSDDNIFWAFELSHLYRRAKLYESCVRKIEKNYQFLLGTNNFLNCSRRTVKSIVMIDFEVRIDFIIFEACMKWAKHTCKTSNINPSADNLVETLGDILDLIRFTSMTSAEFIKCHTNYGEILNTDRLKDILKAIIGDGV